MSTAEKIAAVLAPHLGAHSAESVAQHICAKYGIHEDIAPDKLAELRDFMRRGLVAFVGAAAAGELADVCMRAVRPESDGAVPPRS